MIAQGTLVNHYPYPYHWGMPWFYSVRHARPIDFMRPGLTGARVLDVGCGDGRLTAFLADYAQIVCGIDNQERPLRFAKLIVERPNVHFVQYDGSSFPFPPGSFDIVTCFDVIEHIPPDDVPTLLAAICATLKPGGSAYFTTPNRRSLRARVIGHKTADKHYQEFELNELLEIIRATDLQVGRTCGIYLAPPVPRIEHFASVHPFRSIFAWLVRAGERWPKLSETLFVQAIRPLGVSKREV
jgi:SAM-dependent methyltransferase